MYIIFKIYIYIFFFLSASYTFLPNLFNFIDFYYICFPVGIYMYKVRTTNFMCTKKLYPIGRYLRTVKLQKVIILHISSNALQ